MISEEDEQILINTVNEQRIYIDSLIDYFKPNEHSDLDDILGCNQLLLEILVPPKHKLIKLFDRDENKDTYTKRYEEQ